MKPAGQPPRPDPPAAGPIEIFVSRRRWRKLASFEVVTMKREEGRQDLAFNSRPFVLCGLPIRRPAKTVLEYTRQNGRFFLNITGHPRFGLPFGQDRLIPIWVATLALRQGDRVIRFETASQILDTFGLAKDGKTYRRLVEGFKRVFAATIFFGTEQQRQTFVADGIIPNGVEQTYEIPVLLSVNLFQLDKFHIQMLEGPGAEEVRCLVQRREHCPLVSAHHRRQLVEVADEDHLNAAKGRFLN